MGGMERASVNLSNSLVLQGQEVVFISLFRKEHFLTLDPRILLIEAPIGINESKLNIVKTIKWIRETIYLLKPNTTLVFNKFYGAIVAIATSYVDTPIYITERSSPLFRWPWHIRIFNRIAYFINSPDGIIAQTNVAAEYQRKYYSKKTVITVIPNPLSEIKLYPEIKKEKIILAVGRISDPLKGFDRLFFTFSLILNKDWDLHIAGGDENNKELNKLAENYNISNRIVFLGKVKEIDKIYAKASIFVMPSRSEGFPNSLCEAMASGLPCISFDFIAGPRDIITNGYDGIIVPDDDMPAMAEKIDYLIGNEVERLRLGNNALKIRDRLNANNITTKFMDFILSKNK